MEEAESQKDKTRALLRDAKVQVSNEIHYVSRSIKVRPKIMTVMAAFMGLVPIMFSMSAGSDVMKRIAAPMIGGLFSSFILELLIYPALYFMWRKKR